MRARPPNPLTSGSPPQYVFGGMGMPQLWTYRGRQLHATELRRRHGWKVEWDEPAEEGDKDWAVADDLQLALGSARFKIDLHELGAAWSHTAKGLDHVIDTMGIGPITRGTLARAAEVKFQRALAGEDERPISKSHAKAFFDLSVSDRIRLIDEVIADQIRVGALAPNPARSEISPADLAAWATTIAAGGTGNSVLDEFMLEHLTLEQILRLQRGEDTAALRRAVGSRLARRLTPQVRASLQATGAGLHASAHANPVVRDLLAW